MTAATKKAPAPGPADTGSLDYLQHALDDLAGAREQAQQEARARIDSAVQTGKPYRVELPVPVVSLVNEAREMQPRAFVLMNCGRLLTTALRAGVAAEAVGTGAAAGHAHGPPPRRLQRVDQVAASSRERLECEPR